MSPIFTKWFCCQVQVSWKIGKVKKDEDLIHHWKQEKVTIRLCRKICWVIIVTHTAEMLSELSQTYEMKPFPKMVNHFHFVWLGSKYACLKTSNVLILIVRLSILKNRMKNVERLVKRHYPTLIDWIAEPQKKNCQIFKNIWTIFCTLLLFSMVNYVKLEAILKRLQGPFKEEVGELQYGSPAVVNSQSR